ncbi:MAG: cell division protein FtsA [Prevotellaceae bacterium]|jgi:cell division protein FtsA|nr:cell division protein FtsA [Prevotellaceae bacterium]
MSNYIVAIDLGTTKVVSIAGEKIDGGLYRILAYGETPSEGIRRGQVENIDSVTSAVIPTLNDIKAKMGITEIKNVYVGIAGQNITCIENRTEKIRDKYDEIITEAEIKSLEADARKLHLNPGNEVLHAVSKTYSIDETHGITDPVGRLGHKLTGHFLVIIGKEATRIHTDVCMRNLNLSLQKLILEPIASARATLSEEEREMGVAMIDMGGGTTDLIVYNEGTVKHTAVIPFGGNVITSDIKNGCGILFAQAEKAKIKYGSCTPPVHDNQVVVVPGINGRPSREIRLSALTSIINHRLNEIIDMVMKEIERGDCGRLNAGIVITGGVAKMSGIETFLRAKTKMDVKTGKPDYVSADSPEEIRHPKYSTAVGLIMCGFDYQENSATVTPFEPVPEIPDPDPNPEPVKTGSIKHFWELFKSWIKEFMNPQQEEKND